MPTLSRLFPSNRLAPLRRVPFWAQALALCALFAIAGVAALDDYGITVDEPTQRQVAIANADYIATGDIGKLSQATSDIVIDIVYRYYGMAFEMPLLLAERALGLQDSRHIYLTRHLLSHLLFIAGGFACGMLAYRTLGSRWVALLAMLMFLLHPRLYAHSFFNSKDISFAAMLLIALYLAHRAFRRDTIGAFLLCGLGAGLAINLRVFGLLLPPMILAMRALDLWQASGGAERKRVLLTSAAFLAAALGTAYIIHPYYWENPLRFVEGVRALSQHPFVINILFMGEIYKPRSVPWNYIPVWFAITAPPLTLLLGAVGCAAVCWQAITRPLAALRDRETRFRIMPLGCFALPVVAVVALQSNLYDGWRHMYFLWAPFCLLAAIGLHYVANIRIRGIWKIGARLPGWIRGGGRLRMAPRTLAYGIAGAGLITTLTAMAALHPYEYVYFNALTDTKTPGALANRYDMDYLWMAHRQLLERLLARYPDDALRVWPRKDHIPQILPQEDRNRVINLGNPHMADFYLFRGLRKHPLIRRDPRGVSYYLHPRIVDPQNIPEPLYVVRAYGSAVASIFAKDADAYPAAYADVAANGTLFARSAFDIYDYDGALYYLNANCAPPISDEGVIPIFLHIFPADPADLPVDSRERGFENKDFWLSNITSFAFFDGKCIIRRPLPDYPVARVRTGQDAAASGGAEWRVDVNLAARAAAQAAYDGIAAGDYGQPVAQSDFDVYLRGGVLAYLKENCAPDDTEARFFLHIFPADPADLPADRRKSGFENRDFRFGERGAYAGDKCVASRELPSYAIDRIRTGQFVSGEGELWSAELAVER